MARQVTFYFDFISPFAWLALMRAEDFAAKHDVKWDLRPVVYAALLDAHGLSGPPARELSAESPSCVGEVEAFLARPSAVERRRR